MPRKATSKSKKKTEVEAIPAAEPAPLLEPDEPELTVAARAGLDAAGEPSGKAAPKVMPDAEAELLAEAADTFEQAFEDRRPVEHPEPAVIDAGSPTVKKRKSKKTKADKATEEDHEAPEAAPDAGKTDVAGSDAEESDSAAPDWEEPQPARLERLQKILSQAGVASRRHAEEMITEGRVQVNGKIVTELGSKANPDRDHIRVDGKLIHGAERLRYFVLNKPKGYVTTVSDPEGRPTVMEFFKKAGERLYPVGRLDYHSEGLLLVTNDGDLANKLTKAATGVEKTYLVKVSGQPTEEELDRLREGVAIDRGRPGEGRVRTGPSAVREARSGDNPWYEVVLTEGRNRELRKMFEEIGHHVEKIRRVGYGPLVLDVEPGQFRELEPDELVKLRLAAEGKWRKPKPKEPRRETGRRTSAYGDRPKSRATGTTKPRWSEGRARGAEGFDRRRPSQPQRSSQPPAKREWGPPKTTGRPYQTRGAESKPGGRREGRRPDSGGGEGAAWKPQRPRPEGDRQGREQRENTGWGNRRGAGFSRPSEDRPRGNKPGFSKPGFSKPGFSKPGFSKPGFSKPGFNKTGFNKPGFREDRGGQRPQRGNYPPPKRQEPSRSERPLQSERPSRSERPTRPERPARFDRREQPASGGYRRPGAGGGDGRRPSRGYSGGSARPGGRKPPSQPRASRSRGRDGGRRPQ